ncbi:protein of unknown function [Noviherbaspirillum humi]|uniref:DUF4148 domain-containing protein n=1 Tax=Noviherbaspirillum humi TaxID=1688639 RepID=A0A239CNL5_9BURK|nr:DUF4148 domain-containing protein [Noviherbaspirillum humi]SNS21539.1 protein of unknown function [Noviherbaspirillum humi]
MKLRALATVALFALAGSAVAADAGQAKTRDEVRAELAQTYAQNPAAIGALSGEFPAAASNVPFGKTRAEVRAELNEAYASNPAELSANSGEATHAVTAPAKAGKATRAARGNASEDQEKARLYPA